MGRKQSLRSKAVHLVSDFTTILLNPISDKPSKQHPNSKPPSDNANETKTSDLEPIDLEGSNDTVNGPDTSSFTAFLYSLLSSESGENSNSEGQNDNQMDRARSPPIFTTKENGVKRSLFSRGRQSLGSAIHRAARVTGFEKGNSETVIDCGNDTDLSGVEMKNIQRVNEPVASVIVPEISEPSILLSEKSRNVLYASLPAILHGRKWLLIYSTWRHGISLNSLYRRSMRWPGLSLLVVGDREGAVFGGLVEAPLKATNKKYQGTNNSFVFTNLPGHPMIYRPTGINRYFTLCGTDFLAIGGGGRFALYLDDDLLNGSSSVSETYGNPCLAHSEDFQIKEVELWGFVHASRYEEVLAMSRTEAPQGICHW